MEIKYYLYLVLGFLLTLLPLLGSIYFLNKEKWLYGIALMCFFIYEAYEDYKLLKSIQKDLKKNKK